MDFVVFLVAFAGVFIIVFRKGPFGGDFAAIGIPLLSLIMDPLSAGVLLAPLLVGMDLVALLVCCGSPYAPCVHSSSNA
jgi:hypothetical protein